ncbi:MAG TPA: glutamate-cysteine ligase family protein, partial [Solirubrobacteraceae bacterium]|nr:glutamate-cysteine ligase family protein [Solirubrobacteraceae bacterium]
MPGGVTVKPTPAAGALDATALRRRFDAFETPSFGVEEEVFLVDPRTFDLAHLARELLGDGRPGIKLELPACQAELVTTPHGTISAALAELGAAREQLVG